VAVSGGIDSSVCAALAVRALGKERVLGLLLPERDSSPGSLARGKLLCRHLGTACEVQDIAPALEAIGCYRASVEAIRLVIPEYGDGWKHKIVINGNLLESGRLNFFRIVVQDPGGERKETRLPLEAYLKLVAATNFKQRIRKTVEYYHADRLHYAVVGTPNRLEYDQGFFVKNGDGSADVKPIAHLYKSQVYELARFLGLPEEICGAAPTTDTYSLAQGQDEFYFGLPYDKMDLALYGVSNGRTASEVAAECGFSAVQVERVFRDIEAKRRTTRPLHLGPILMEPVPGISTKGEPGAAGTGQRSS
jgi:NAD+ synthase